MKYVLERVFRNEFFPYFLFLFLAFFLFFRKNSDGGSGKDNDGMMQ